MNDEQTKLLLNQRALDALKERIAAESYLKIGDVMKRLNLSRQVVEALPVEVLPFANYSQGDRRLRRYHPADVLACDAKLRQWERAKQRGEGEAYLTKLRGELEERDAAACAMAAAS